MTSVPEVVQRKRRAYVRPPPLLELGHRERTMIRLLVHGVDRHDKPPFPVGYTPGKPMANDYLCEYLNIKRNQLSLMLHDPLFMAEYHKALQVRHAMLKPHAWRTVETLMESPQDMVALKAAEVVLKEPAGHQTNINVGVAVQNNQQPTPGYAIRLPAKHSIEGENASE